jgi:hypothetical protein
LDGFQLLLQFYPNPMLQCSSLLAHSEPLGGLDLAIRDVLAVRLFPYAGAIDERARTDLRFAGQYPDKKVYKGIGVFTVKLALAEPEKRKN